ncbi:MAG: TlyA family RNA methyltransferase [bacterium]
MQKQLERIDLLLVKSGKVQSRERARLLIMSGNVSVNNKIIDKPGKQVPSDSIITINQQGCPYVSRGGLKLQKAIEHFGIDLKGKVAIDVGASTGGFTDCLLQHSASFVYAVDVGYGQIDLKLRNDNRVFVMERTNIRYVKPEMFSSKADIVTIDVSFISLDKVLPAVIPLMKDYGQIIALIKPQFEAGRKYVSKGGVVRDQMIHQKVIKNITETSTNLGLLVKGITYSPIKGPAGNIEYFIYLEKGSQIFECCYNEDMIKEVVSSAHRAFNDE